ncbi:hypothetical protein [Streptomyces sp. NPDC057280]|uniref:hypothetical protein n=1 Tax=Streptomyces sp. NPDC057280 TaxID=3346081 RepID=UPI00363806A9
MPRGPLDLVDHRHRGVRVRQRRPRPSGARSPQIAPPGARRTLLPSSSRGSLGRTLIPLLDAAPARSETRLPHPLAARRSHERDAS